MSQDLPSATDIATRLNNARNGLNDLNEQMRGVIERMRKSGDLPETCRGYKEMNDAYEAMNNVRKELFEQLEGVSRATIPEMLAEQKVPNITVTYHDGLNYRFGKNQRVSVSIVEGQKELAYDWLRANGGEALIQPTVNSSKLASFAKEVAKEKGMDLPLDKFKTSSMVYTSITKA